MNESEKIDPRELSPLALAFVGDSVLELLVRQRLVEHHRLSAGKLNAEKVKYVSAKAQFREEQLLEPLFTEDELAVFKRGRNASKASVAKHASPEEYRASTGFECLLGWLYLNGQRVELRGSSLILTRNKNAKARCFPHWKPVVEGSGLCLLASAVRQMLLTPSAAVLRVGGTAVGGVLGAFVIGTLGVLVGVLVLVGGAVGGLAAGTVRGLVLAIGTAVLTAVFHGVNAPFGRCCGGGAALTVHSVAAAGGFIHPMGGKEYAYGIF